MICRLRERIKKKSYGTMSALRTFIKYLLKNELFYYISTVLFYSILFEYKLILQIVSL